MSNDNANSTPGPVLALDVGTRRIGLAVSDQRRSMALPLETVDARSTPKALQRIVDQVRDYEVAEIVVGWPLDMQGVEGRAVDRVRRIIDGLERQLEKQNLADVPIYRWDERLTTTAADRLLIDADMSRSRRKTVVDQVAACKILEGFLAQARQNGGGRP